MQPTSRLLATAGFPGFWKRSLDEFKRISQVAIKLEGLEKPKNSYAIWDFSHPQAVEACVDMSDNDIGGYSEARIAHIAQSDAEPAHAHFSGSISNQLPLKDLKVERSGYAAWRTRERPSTLFGRALWDVDMYKYLALRVKSDGRKYKVNIQTESIEFTDLHQHRLYAKRPGSWETVLIKWSDFVRTNHGFIVEPQSEMLKEKVRTIGVGLTDGHPGTFDFRISKIWATNGLTDDEREASGQNDREFVPKHLKDRTESSSERQISQI